MLTGWEQIWWKSSENWTTEFDVLSIEELAILQCHLTMFRAIVLYVCITPCTRIGYARPLTVTILYLFSISYYQHVCG